MPVNLPNLLLVAGSLLTAAAALFWPQLEQAWLAHASSAAHGGIASSGTAGGMGKASKGKCPLGYEGDMPANHPPIGPGIKAAGGAGPAAAAAAATARRPQRQQQQQHGMVTFTNAVIWTADAKAPWASAMTVNLDTGEVASLANTSSTPDSSSGAVVVDMQGAFIMPGFVDPHVHLIPGGLSLSNVNLRVLRGGQTDMAARLAAAAAGSSPGRAASPSWIIGTGWSESDWGGQLPTRTWIDEACGGRPAFLSRMDTHMALVNTAALEAAGLMQPTAAGPAADLAAVAAADAEGLIDRDPDTGLPTGLLRESAMNLVERHIPPPSVADRAAALQAAGRYLTSRGVTSVGDMGWGLFGPPAVTWQDLEEVYDAAAHAGTLPVRIAAYVPLASWRRLAARVAAHGTSHPRCARLAWGGTKAFADGSLGSSTALMWEPYADAAAAADADAAGAGGAAGSRSNVSSCPEHACGTRTIATQELLQQVKGAAGAGLQVAVHAIGDRAVDEVIQVFEQALDSSSGSGNGGACHRIEHVQHISSLQAAAHMAALGVAGVLNPQHLLSDRPMLLPKLGRERAGPGRAFAYKTLADAGVELGFGSDFPVVEVDPWTSVYAAVHRSDPPSSPMQQQGQQRCPSSAGGSADGNGACNGDDGAVATVRGSGGGDEAALPAQQQQQQAPWEGPEEQLSLQQALLGHTLHAARLAGLEHWVGALRPGLRADFLVLDRSPFDDAGGGAFGRNGGGGAVGTAAGGARADRTGGLEAGLPLVARTYMDGVCVYGHGCGGAGGGMDGAGAAAPAS